MPKTQFGILHELQKVRRLLEAQAEKETKQAKAEEYLGRVCDNRQSNLYRQTCKWSECEAGCAYPRFRGTWLGPEFDS